MYFNQIYIPFIQNVYCIHYTHTAVLGILSLGKKLQLNLISKLIDKKAGTSKDIKIIFVRKKS